MQKCLLFFATKHGLELRSSRKKFTSPVLLLPTMQVNVPEAHPGSVAIFLQTDLSSWSVKFLKLLKKPLSTNAVPNKKCVSSSHWAMAPFVIKVKGPIETDFVVRRKPIRFFFRILIASDELKLSELKSRYSKLHSSSARHDFGIA